MSTINVLVTYRKGPTLLEPGRRCWTSVSGSTLYYTRKAMDKPRQRGDRVVIISGKYTGLRGTVQSLVFQKTVDYPEDAGDACHVALDDIERVVTIRSDQVQSA